jgi:iron complex transport system permease protein
MIHRRVSTEASRTISTTGDGVAAARSLYHRITYKKLLILLALSVVLMLSVLVDVSYGPSGLTMIGVLQTIFSPPQASAVHQVIVWDIRLPMALMAVLIGFSLSISGAQMQTILNNPLASPFTLGISAAASFGASLAIVAGIGVIPGPSLPLVAINAFAFAAGASLFIYGFSKLRGVSTETMVLLGIALVFLFSSLLALMQYIASEQALQEVVFWTLGSLSKATWPRVGIMALVLAVTLPFFLTRVWKLTALRLGDESAQSLGVDVGRLRLQVLIAVALLASTAVAFVGTIGFVGLVGPHVARMLVGEDQRYFLPTSAVAGALLLSFTAIVSKSIIPGALVPIGIITSLVGVPFFLSIIMVRRRQLW